MMRGLTLIELLVVVFILAAIAATAVNFVDNADLQARHDDTRTRLALVRAAVVGRPDRTVNGEPELSGFVADVGRLPASIGELLQAPAGAPGWRGPYLQTLPDSGGALAFRDGWGNDWRFERAPSGDSLLVQSLGSDGAAGGAEYAADYPAAGNLVDPDDYTVDLARLSFSVVFTGAPNASATVRLRADFPDPATGAATSARSANAETVTVPESGRSDPVAFTFAAMRAPIGVRDVVVVEDASDAPLGGSPAAKVAFPARAQLVVRLAWRVP